MKGKAVSIMKTWWIIAAVFVLALSLTSCSRLYPYGANSNYGINFCDGSIGEIDVYTVAVTGQPGVVKVVIIPASLAMPGEAATITVVNGSTLDYKTLLTQVSLQVDSQIVAGYLSQQELQMYDRIAITSYTPGVDFRNSSPARDAICGLPLLGDGNNNYNY